MVEDSLDAIGQGFDILKIKVGKEGEKDVERVCAIREAVGPNVKLRVDANPGLGGPGSGQDYPRHGGQGA